LVTSGRHRRDGVEEVPWYESRRQARERPGWLGPAAVGTGSVLLVAGAVLVGSTFFPAAVTGRSGCDGPQVTARVAAAPDHAPVLRRCRRRVVARPAPGGRRVRVGADRRGGVRRGRLGPSAPTGPGAGRTPGRRSPRSGPAWPPAAPRPRPPCPPNGISLAVSPVVIAVPRERAKALRWPAQRLSWAGRARRAPAGPHLGPVRPPGLGRFVVGLSDPTRSTAALHTLLAWPMPTTTARWSPPRSATS
jgi:hypothetical protein